MSCTHTGLPSVPSDSFSAWMNLIWVSYFIHVPCSECSNRKVLHLFYTCMGQLLLLAADNPPQQCDSRVSNLKTNLSFPFEIFLKIRERVAQSQNLSAGKVRDIKYQIFYLPKKKKKEKEALWSGERRRAALTMAESWKAWRRMQIFFFKNRTRQMLYLFWIFFLFKKLIKRRWKPQKQSYSDTRCGSLAAELLTS